ncbi:MFS transporter [Escherichia coli]|uniref:MFS transporter n=1 Tax=Escherichia coli TaxID=562 RepID=UPI0038906970
MGSLYRADRGGITGATGAVAGAYIADITDGDERARHFGFMSACFGFGMVAGPVLGGLMGGFSPTLRSSPRQP